MFAVALAGLLLGIVSAWLAGAWALAHPPVPPPPTRQVFIERLRASGHPEADEFAHVLELGPAVPGETLRELHASYIEFLTMLPSDFCTRA